MTSAIPPGLHEPKPRATYCRALERQTTPLGHKARSALEQCVELASEHAQTGPAVTACKALLKRYPTPRKP